MSPLLDRETRDARVIASLAQSRSPLEAGHLRDRGNPARRRRPAKVIVPEGRCKPSRASDACSCATARALRRARSCPAARTMAPSRSISGVDAGETIAVANTFTLKAELGKAEAEHEH